MLPPAWIGPVNLWHRIRLWCPDPIKVAIRRVRSRIIDPLDRGIWTEISGTRVRTPGYFKGGGRAGYELSAVRRFRGWLSAHPKGTVMDIGCSVSTYGIIALSSSPNTQVIAIDPDFASLVWTRFLCSKVDSPSRLRLVHGFLDSRPDQKGEAGLPDRDPRFARPFAVETKYQDSNDSSNRDVPRHSVDFLLGDQDLSGGLLLKIDVEGKELAVLQGAVETLAHVRPTVLLSVHPFFGVDPVVVRQFLRSAGYAAEHFETDHEEHWWCLPVPAGSDEGPAAVQGTLESH